MPVFYLMLVFHGIVLTPTHYWLHPVGILLGIAGLVMLWVKEPPIVRDIEPVGSGDETVTTKGA